MAQATGTNGGVQLASTTPQMQGMSEEMRRCIQDCLECANICEQTIAYCLTKGGKHASPEHIRVMRDCAESCMMAASMMARDSNFQSEHCALCADICRACEESCEKFGGDAQMKACADACRQCGDSCRRMGKVA